MSEEGKIKLVDEEEGVVVLEEPDGISRTYEIVTALDIEEQSYLILMEEDDEVGEGYALKASKDEAGEKIYIPVIDQQELLRLQQELEE